MDQRETCGCDMKYMLVLSCAVCMMGAECFGDSDPGLMTLQSSGGWWNHVIQLD